MNCHLRFASLVTSLFVLALSFAPRASVQGQSTGEHDVVANLWEWNWHSVGQECTTVLGPNGYGGVQVAPPQDSVSLSENTPAHPWWEVYQPVDYNLTSRMGNESQFKDMVTACRNAGVKVYVDAVINHMTGQGSVSYGGVHFSKYNYPGLYTDINFHHYPADCPQPDGTIHDFNDYAEVTKCELLGLADLRTESAYVRDTVAAYLNKLLGYGVSGFRVDAAKHIGQTDLAAIESRLNTTLDGAPPYIALEVIPGSPDQLAPEAFEPVGSLLGFDYAGQMRSEFMGHITGLRTLGEQSRLLPSDKELVFVENHDTERDSSTLSYKVGRTNVIATEFMLAWPYGKPEVYASFSWNGTDDSPPSDSTGLIRDTDCAHGWVCTDRQKGVAHMVAWHDDVGAAPVSKWYSDRNNLIAFSRGNKGWIAINNESKARTRTFSTGLPKGRYCEIIHGTYHAGSCSGPIVKVDGRGRARLRVHAKDAVAIEVNERVGK